MSISLERESEAICLYQTTSRLVLTKLANNLVPVTFYWRLRTLTVTSIFDFQVVQHSQRFLEEETEDGYKPCDPSIIVERVQTLEGAYEELVKLAVERRSRLEESRQLWQFYWDMAEEENWIKEMQQIVSQGDIGHDLVS